MNVCYRITDGFAHDLRFVMDGYVAQEGDIILVNRDQLPVLETLNDPSAVAVQSVPAASLQDQIDVLTQAVNALPGGADALTKAQTTLSTAAVNVKA